LSVVQSDPSVARPAERQGPVPLIGWARKRRPLLTALFVLAALFYALWSDNRPVDLFDPDGSALFIVAWAAMLLGVAVRIWGSGNLRKNKEITRTGIYQMVRHPLYTGSLLMFLAYYLALGDPVVDVALFLGMVVLVYYPTMLNEEAHLLRKFPEQVGGYESLPRLVPNPLRLPEAARTDRFTVRAAYKNLGLRSLWFLLALPLLTKALIWVEGRLPGG
jgi:protein-S-isoprenylcysteine O-methyltransferase Ste14